MPTSARHGAKREAQRFFAGRAWFFMLLVGADDPVRPLKCFEFASDFRENGHFRRADRVVRPYGAKWEIGTALLCPPPIKQKILPSQRAESRGTRVSAILRGATQVQRTRVLPFPALTGRSPVISAVVRLIHMLGGCPSRSVPQEPLSKTAPSLTGTRRYCFRVIADEIFSGSSVSSGASCASPDRRAADPGSAFPPRPDWSRTGRCRCRTDGSCASGADPPTGHCRSGRKRR